MLGDGDYHFVVLPDRNMTVPIDHKLVSSLRMFSDNSAVERTVLETADSEHMALEV